MNLDEIDPLINTLYRVLELIGVFLASIVGGTVARKLNFDIIGFLFMALVSSLGGGMLRDFLIGRGTVAAMANQEYLWLALAGALIAWLAHLRGWLWDMLQFHMDMVVLGVWAVTGTTKALNYGLPWVACVFMGVLTAVGGGLIRDVAVGRVPTLFRGQQMYVIPAIIASVCMIAFFEAGNQPVGMVVSPIIAFTLAMASYWLGWYIPANQDFAPLNSVGRQLRAALSPVEAASREFARDIEPDSVRKWRHGQMEQSAESAEAEAEQEQRERTAEETVTEQAVRSQLDDDASRDEFLDALYRAYRDAADSDTRDNEKWSARRTSRSSARRR